MSREIKFRAWDLRDQRDQKRGIPQIVPRYGKVLEIHFDTGNVRVAYADGTTACLQIGEECVLEQYTGLKDENGVEIYEGDILEDGSGEPIEYWVVKFEDGKFIGETQGVSEDIYELADLAAIGNIHENPELLENQPTPVEVDGLHQWDF